VNPNLINPDIIFKIIHISEYFQNALSVTIIILDILLSTPMKKGAAGKFQFVGTVRVL